jgi:hypothetical protein
VSVAQSHWAKGKVRREYKTRRTILRIIQITHSGFFFFLNTPYLNRLRRGNLKPRRCPNMTIIEKQKLGLKLKHIHVQIYIYSGESSINDPNHLG